MLSVFPWTWWLRQFGLMAHDVTKANDCVETVTSLDFDFIIHPEPSGFHKQHPHSPGPYPLSKLTFN